MSSASNLYITTSATLRREFRALLRSTRVFVATGLLTGVVALLCVSSYPFGGESTSSSGVHYARVIVNVQLFSLWLAVLTALPALAVLGVHQDNRSGMLEHLACTPLNPRVLYGSRAVALAALYLIGAAAVLPISGIAFFLAGVEITPFLGQLVSLTCFAACMIVVSIETAVRIPATVPAILRVVAVGLTIGGSFVILLQTMRLGVATGYLAGLVIQGTFGRPLPTWASLRKPQATDADALCLAVTRESRVPLDIPDSTRLSRLRNSLVFTRLGDSVWTVWVVGLTAAAAGFFACLEMLECLAFQPRTSAILYELLHSGLGVFLGYMLGWVVTAVRGPSIFQHSYGAVLLPIEQASLRSAAPTYHRPAIHFGDRANPVAALEQRFSIRPHDKLPLGCALFPAGFLFRILSFLTTMIALDSVMPAVYYTIDSLLWATGAIIAAAVVVRDCNRINLDALRCTLLSGREFLNGKVGAAWRVLTPLLAGWYAADFLTLHMFWQTEPPLRFIYHVVLVALNVPEFHIVLLLVAAGATLGYSTKTRIASALLFSVPGLLVPGLAGDYLEHILVRPNSSQNYIEQFGTFVAVYSLVVGAALVLAMLFARWRFRRLWRGAGD